MLLRRAAADVFLFRSISRFSHLGVPECPSRLMAGTKPHPPTRLPLFAAPRLLICSEVARLLRPQPLPPTSPRLAFSRATSGGERAAVLRARCSPPIRRSFPLCRPLLRVRGVLVAALAADVVPVVVVAALGEFRVFLLRPRALRASCNCGGVAVSFCCFPFFASGFARYQFA